MTHAEIVAACRASKEFFFENYYQIPVVGKGAMPFELRDYQRVISQRIEEETKIIGLKARQIGWTTIGVANALWDCLFNEEHPWLLVSRTEDAAQKMLEKAVYAYYRLPAWMRGMLPKVEVQTQSVLKFSNGSRIESVPATASTGRGDAVYGALLDECAFMEYADEIWAAIEPLVYGVAMIFSTANGMGNFFHEVWLDSEQPDSVWHGIFYPWNVVPERDQDWYDIKRLSFRGREWFFYQEYPQTPEEAFAKSGRVAFQADVVDYCFQEIEPANTFKWVIGDGPTLMEPGEIADIEIFQWKEPRVVRDEHKRPLYKPSYVVGADIAEGLEHGDWSYVTVFDANTGEQMASCRSGIPVSYIDELIAWLAEEYWTALVIVERNNAGILPIDRLYRDRWYPRLYRMDSFARQRTSDRTPQYGWRTDRATKPKMVNDFVFALTEGAVLLHDPHFVLESRTFVSDGKGSYAATSKNTDDVIMGTLIAYQGVLDTPLYQNFWQDSEIVPITHDELDKIIFHYDNDFTAADQLDLPLGGRQPDDKPIKSFVVVPNDTH
jgi:hypothetical protein